MLATASIVALVFAAPLTEGAPAFAPGEETVFDIRYLDLPAGEGRILVGRAEGSIWPLIFQARSSGVARIVPIREQLVSYWDVAVRLPRGSDLYAIELGDYREDRSRIDRQRGELTFEVRRKGRRTVEVFAVPPGVQDLTSAFMWLRMQPLATGDRLEIPIASGTSQFTLVADVIGREEVPTSSGKFRTVKVNIRLGLKGNFATRRDVTLWLSDDARHLLVRASAQFAIGSMVVTLKSYRAGGLASGSGGRRPTPRYAGASSRTVPGPKRVRSSVSISTARGRHASSPSLRRTRTSGAVERAMEAQASAALP